MISPEDVRELSQSKERQCLTVYLNTGPKLARSAYLATFKKLIRSLAPSVPPQDRKEFDVLAAKLAGFLEQYRSEANSMLIVTFPSGRKQYASRVPVRDEAWWGEPNVNQLLWLLEEYRPYGVLIADQQKVRFLAVRLNEFEEFQEFNAEIDTSEWRKQVMGTSGRGNSYQKGGKDLEKFNSRYMEQVRSFWRSLHRPLSELIDRYHVQRLVVAGTKSLVPDFLKTLPPKLNETIVTQIGIESFTNPTDAVKRIWPQIEIWERKREAGIVSELLDFAGVSRKAAIGVESVLKYVQEGRASRLVVTKGFDREIVQCGRCHYVSTNHMDTCRQCSAPDIQRGVLASVLPRMVIRYSVPVEIVKGEAGIELNRSGGIGVFLRF
jgi:hypothetical protein